MKKEIIKLLECKEATFYLNDICYLRRCKGVNIVGSKFDTLELNFKRLNNTTCNYPIYSRDFDGISKEICNAFDDYYNAVAEQSKKEFLHGYNNCGGTCDKLQIMEV